MAGSLSHCRGRVHADQVGDGRRPKMHAISPLTLSAGVWDIPATARVHIRIAQGWLPSAGPS